MEKEKKGKKREREKEKNGTSNSSVAKSVLYLSLFCVSYVF
jgi:hypothetical protein